MEWIWWVVGFFVVRDILAWMFGWGGAVPAISELLADRKHNAAIDKQWWRSGRPIVSTSIGWRPDPWNKEDGFRDNGDGSFSRLIRGGTKEYRDKFVQDVERSKR